MELQHFNFKLLLARPAEADLKTSSSTFPSWTQGQVGEELLLDVADYRHARAGRGVGLIGHEGNYTLHMTEGPLRVRSNRKTVAEESNQDGLSLAAREALTACQRLEIDPPRGGRSAFRSRGSKCSSTTVPLARTHRPAARSWRWNFKPFLRYFCLRRFCPLLPEDPRTLLAVGARSARTYASAEQLANLEPLRCSS